MNTIVEFPCAMCDVYNFPLPRLNCMLVVTMRSIVISLNEFFGPMLIVISPKGLCCRNAVNKYLHTYYASQIAIQTRFGKMRMV